MNGIIDSSGVYEWVTIGHDLRASVSLTSAAPNRMIEISINGGQDFTEAQYDVEADNVIGFAILAPIDALRFTGEEGDEWMVLR